MTVTNVYGCALANVLIFFFIVSIHLTLNNKTYRSALTGPAKHQKKTSCACTGRNSHVMHSLCGVTYFLSRQCDVMAAFLFGACAFRHFSESLSTDPCVLRLTVSSVIYLLVIRNLR